MSQTVTSPLLCLFFLPSAITALCINDVNHVDFDQLVTFMELVTYSSLMDQDLFRASQMPARCSSQHGLLGYTADMDCLTYSTRSFLTWYSEREPILLVFPHCLTVPGKQFFGALPLSVPESFHCPPFHSGILHIPSVQTPEKILLGLFAILLD